eukprot:1194552-Prorocentrum_minimum.AAC.1
MHKSVRLFHIIYHYPGDEQCDQAGEDPVACLERRIEWDVDDPNLMRVRYKSGTNLRLLTTRRSQETEEANKFSTSEYYQVPYSKLSPIRISALRICRLKKWRKFLRI